MARRTLIVCDRCFIDVIDTDAGLSVSVETDDESPPLDLCADCAGRELSELLARLAPEEVATWRETLGRGDDRPLRS